MSGTQYRRLPAPGESRPDVRLGRAGRNPRRHRGPGDQKLPELTRSAGKEARIFKSEAKALKEQGSGESTASRGSVVSDTVVDGAERSPRP
ncbi:twin-arginine translocase TatA/TatE family subunit [Streptomyces sp. NPDC057963]|uniref:twin-arginine translocase TatA/TatE family subunit n=1 Tax=Streptomyces sp. NPDC057963 TaxID=3346290 RepID=UPI0036E99F98